MGDSQQETALHTTHQTNSSDYGDSEGNMRCDNSMFHLYKMPSLNNKPLKTETNSTRKWVAMTQHIPIDTVTKYVNVPVKDTKIVHVPKIEYVEKLKEVPKYTFQQENKVIEVPEVQFVDKIHYEPYVVEKLKYVPKEVVQYNVIKKPVVKNIINEKRVDVIKVKEQIKYKTQEITEEVYNYFNPYPNKNVDSNENITNNENGYQIEEARELNFENPRYQYVNDNNTLPTLLEPFGNQIKLREQTTIEKVHIPKIEKVVEIKKKIDIPIDYPVPYIVPKPNIIDINVPVLKFKNKYVPVPIRRKIIPKIKWSDKKYVVDCVIEKPYIVYHDIIKIIPTDSKITVREYPKGISKINPGSLTEQDNLAIWMNVNANLKKEKDKEKEAEKQNYPEENASSYSCVCSEAEENEHTSYSDINTSQECATTKSSNENIVDTLPLHPGHPLAIVHLQNKWLKEDTTKTQDLYDEPFLKAHKNAVFNLATGFPREAEVEPSQIAAIQKQNERTESIKRYNEPFIN